MENDLFDAVYYNVWTRSHTDRYPAAPGHRGVDTSIVAAEHMKKSAAALRQVVLDALADNGPMTTREICDYTGAEYDGLQPRTSELSAVGKIVDSGQRRTPPGRRVAVIVWKLPTH